jgi:hypothetical protein
MISSYCNETGFHLAPPSRLGPGGVDVEKYATAMVDGRYRLVSLGGKNIKRAKREEG